MRLWSGEQATKDSPALVSKCQGCILSLLALFLSLECLPEAVESRGHLRTCLRFTFHLRVSEAHARHLQADNHKG